MDKQELLKIQEHLRRCFGAPALKVSPGSRSSESADVHFGERKIGAIDLDDEDGDRSFSFEMQVPADRAALQPYLRQMFDNPNLTIAGRLKKTDSVELNNGPDFLGVLSADDPNGKSYTLQMAILDFDLEDL